jgi:hypothetical protein
VGLPFLNHFDRLVVFIAANFAFHNPKSLQPFMPGASERP